MAFAYMRGWFSGHGEGARMVVTGTKFRQFFEGSNGCGCENDSMMISCLGMLSATVL